ncbi:hypothetical protein MASSI9I_20609 [Massilia sp. 9I]|nr:hypothetical protein MASSI9I_20609 [Massilia sp. 9I]
MGLSDKVYRVSPILAFGVADQLTGPVTPVSVGVISTAAPFGMTDAAEGTSPIVGGKGEDDPDAVSRPPLPHAVSSTTEHIAR